MANKILLVEDDKFLRELMTQHMEKEGFEVVGVVDGEEALKRLETEKPDLVLLDLILPGIDGFEVLAKIKQDPSLTSIPVIILSNLGQKEDVDRGLKLGATDYLIKAYFTPKEIVEKVRGVLK